MARLPAPLRRLAAQASRRLGPLGAQRERWVPLVAAGVLLGLVGAALLLAAPGSVSESREIALLDAQPDTALAAIDTDQDRLSDLEELAAGTNPAANDTDSDGLPDTWEVRNARLDAVSSTYCPDPLRADAARDCDGDRLPNEQEFGAGTDPNLADADGDGVLDGLEVVCGSDPFQADASLDLDGDGFANLEELKVGTRCDRADSDLDGLTDPEELNVTHTIPTRQSSAGSGLADGWLQAFHLPLDDASAGFADPDGDALTNLEEYQFAATLAVQEGPRCGCVVQGKNLTALFTRGLDPFRNDTDADGMQDGYEVRFGLDPLDPGTARADLGPEGDPDLDALPNRLEAAAESSPFLADTDGDGLTDFQEVTEGWVVRVGDEARNATSDPSRADSDGDGLGDLEEKLGKATRDGVERLFKPLDPRSPDTDLDGLGDLQEIVLPITSNAEPRRLDPTEADTDRDGLLDGDEYRYWTQRHDGSGSDFEALVDRMAKQMGEACSRSVSREEAVNALGPGGDADCDGRPGLLDGDSDGDSIDDGKEVVPEDKPIEAGSRIRQDLPVTDPALVDTDGEGLPDAWENTYANYRFELGDWNLNASSKDSLRRNDGKTDADRDLDRDGVDYNGTRYARPVLFEFTNRFEFLAGTDPNQLDSDGDGLPDGWETYFTCVTALAPKRICGTLTRPPEAQGDALDLDPSNARTAGTPDADKVATRTPYVRFVKVASSAAADALLDPARGERFTKKDNAGPLDAEGDLFPGVVVRIHGEDRLNFSQAFSKALDPSAADTDGDLMADAWEVAKNLKPLDAGDAKGDADLDTLTNLDEWTKGTDPTLLDTDQGGLDDSKDANPLYPPDDAPEGDTDCDGVVNRLEGKSPAESGSSYDYTASSLADFDSDGDGLLDGPGIAFYTTAQTDVLQASDAVKREGCSLTTEQLKARFVARGIAQNRTGQGGANVLFLGEQMFCAGSSCPAPGKADSDGDGIPDGWEAFYFNLHGITGTPDPLNPGFLNDGDALNNSAEHRTGMPAVWAARECGVWWLGSDPRDKDTDADGVEDGTRLDAETLGVDLDLDNDGLDDFTGEDPALWDATNRAADPLADCAAYQAFVGSFVFGGGRRASVAGPNGIALREDYARTRLVGLAATLDPDGALPVDERSNTILKGARFRVTGRLVVNESGASSDGRGVAGAVVVVNLGHGSADRSGFEADVLGAATTGADGSFTLDGAVQHLRNGTLGDAAVVFGGRHTAGETLRWPPNTSRLPPGAGYRLVVSSLSRQEGPTGPYNVTTSAGFTARGVRGTLAVSAPGDAVLDVPLITLKSSSQLGLSGGLHATAGERLIASGTAVDGLGDPLPRGSIGNGLLRVTWLGTVYRTRPEVAVRDGGYDLELPTDLGTALGAHPILVEYVGDSGLVTGTTLTANAEVRYPTNISGAVQSPDLRAVAGESLVVDGRVADFRGQAVPPGLGVQVKLAGATFPGNTSNGGAFRVDLIVPTDAPVGTQSVEVAFVGGSAYESSRAEAGLVTLVQKTVLTLEGGRSALGRDLVIVGTLADLAGNAVDDPTEETNATVRVATSAGAGDANMTGTEFRFTIPRDQLPGAGALLVRAEFPGSRLYRGSADTREVQLGSKTKLTLDTAPVVRGQPSSVQGRLVDEKLRGIPGEVVEVRFGTLNGTATTDATGRFALPLDLPKDHLLGGVLTEARYAGGREGLLEAAEPVHAVLPVVAATRLELQAFTGALGTLPAKGSLQDDRGLAVPGAKLQMALDNVTVGFAVTDLQGRFEADLPLPDNVTSGTHELRARFGGSGGLGPSEARAAYRLLVPANVTLLRTDPLVRGQEALVLVLVTDAEGKPLPGRSVEVRLEGTVLASGVTDTAGVARILARPPSELPIGNATLEARFRGDDGHTPAVAQLRLPLTARTDLRVDVPAQVEEGQVFRGAIVMRDDAGQPLVGQVVVVNFSRFAYPVALTTDGAGRANFTGRIEGPGVGTLTVRYAGSEGRGPVEQTLQVQSRVPVLAGTGLLGLAVLAAAGVIVASAVAARRLRSRQVQEVERILHEAGERLFASTEYQASILWAYGRLVEHVRQRGFLVQESFTARELTEALAKAMPVALPNLERLVAVFEEARYSPHPIGPRQRDEALAALRGLERDLRAQKEVKVPG